MDKNPNTAKFWDRKIRDVFEISKYDFVTEDRVRSAANLILNLDKKLLDVGFGYGFLENRLQKDKKKINLTGVDLSPIAAKRANTLFCGNFIVGTSKSLSFKNSTFDYVCLLEVLEHLYKNDAISSLREVYRVLNSHGELIVSVPLFDQVYLGHPSGHVRIYTPNDLIEELNICGFRVTYKKFLYAFSNFYLLKNLVNAIFRFKNPNILIVVAEKKDRTDRTDKMVKKEKTDKKNEKDQGDKGNRGMKK